MEVHKIAGIGAGFVGGPTMAVFASKCPGIQVSCCDLDPDKISRWNTDELPIYENGLLELVQTCRGRNLTFSTDVIGEIRRSDIIFITVNTPTKTYGEGAGSAFDLTYLESSVRTIAEALKGCEGKKIIVEKSTVAVRTADMIEQILIHNAPGLNFAVLSNPEFLAEGTAVSDLMDPARVLIGGKDCDAIATLVNLYARWVPRNKILTTSLWSSELAKLCSNAMLAQRISSINSISAVCERVGADVDEVSIVIGSDDRIGNKFLRTSVGFGGSCFAKDVLCLVYICESLGLAEVAHYWRQVIIMNEFQRNRFSKCICTSMNNTLKNKHIAMFGFAYKKNTSDTRETAACYVANSLMEEGAIIHVYDPKVTRQLMLHEMNIHKFLDIISADKQLITETDPYEAIKGANAIVVLTEWDSFKDLDYTIMFQEMIKPAYIFDGRNLLNHAALREIGFRVIALGKSEFRDARFN